MKVELNLNSNLEFKDQDEEDGLPVNGMSCKSGYIKDKDFIIPMEELENIAKTLKEGVDGLGAYILKDHGYTAPFLGKSVDKLVGRINNTEIKGNLLLYFGRIHDKPLEEKIKKRIVTSSSVGLQVDKVFCSICGKEYGHPECTHLLGKEYADEPIHEMAQPYIEEMGGKNIASMVGRGISGREQSIVLFPAIAGASVGFSEESESYINDIENKKIKRIEEEDVIITEEDVENMEEEEITENLGQIVEGFNKEIDENNSEQTMSVELESLQKELETVKGKYADLVAKNENIVNELNTAKELINKYKADEEKRLADMKSAMITKLVELRKERELPEKDYSKLSLDVLTNELELLESIKPKEQQSEFDDGEDNGTNTLKENIRDVIFHKRKDEKKSTGLKSWK